KTPSIKWTKTASARAFGGLIEAYEEVAHRLGVKLD
ncbi:phosphoribosylaminoimidazolesuccinocarboxamide synthase, partial [Klebsiella pneumoniae]